MARTGRLQRVLLLLAAAVLTLLALAWTVPLPERLSTPGSPVVRWRDGSPAHVFLAPDDRWRLPITPEDVDPTFIDALVAYEDQRFFLHFGVDPIAIVRAAAQNLAQGSVRSGASTVTMQVVRVLERRPRTLTSKLVEAFRATQLEIRLSKSEILSAYLTFAPYGRNLEGVEAASLTMFGHSAERLTAAEIATLIAIPQDPNSRYPSPGNERTLHAARERVALRLVEARALPRGRDLLSPDAALETIGRTPVPQQLVPMPRRAPHAARWLVRRGDPSGNVSTTLDSGTQRIAERLLQSLRTEYAEKGIFNASVIVVEHGTGAVRALIGNFDFWDPAHAGQIAAFNVPRSPGSTLKPFIYASAIERGQALPEQLVPDVPVAYGSYHPENFDRSWNGVVRLETALSQSLNLPFIDQLAKLGVEPFLGDLRALGAQSLDPRPGQYGLAVAVGGVELTPLEMAGLYAALAENGAPRPPRLTDTPVLDTPPIFSPAAAWLTRRALAIRDRPDFPLRRSLTGAVPSIHWKTGTSFGFRDAWAIGSGQQYTAVIWLGNLDRQSSIHLVGAGAAAPLLFDLLEALEGVRPTEDLRPDDLIPVEVCALSGHIPGSACPERTHALARRERVVTVPCPYHQRVEFDVRSGLRVTQQCKDPHIAEARPVVVWPPNVRRWLTDQQLAGPELPPFAKDCSAPEGSRPRIQSPVTGEVRVLIPGLPANRQEIPLEAISDASVVHWFVDSVWIGDTPPSERAWWTPAVGKHTVVVTDDAGLSASSQLEIRSGAASPR